MLAVLVVVITMVSCSKSTPASTTSTTSKDTVYHSAWVALKMPFLAFDNNNPPDSVFEQIITSASITQKVLDSAVILTYLQTNAPSVVNANDLSSFLDVEYGLGNITLDSYAYNMQASGLYTAIRFVIIPGNVLTTGTLKGYIKEQLQKMDYKTVTNLLSQ